MPSGIVSSMASSTKAMENHFRAAAKRQGLFLSKSRTRDPRAILFGRWWLYELITERIRERDSGNLSQKGTTIKHTILRYGGPQGIPDLGWVEKVLDWTPEVRRPQGEAVHPTRDLDEEYIDLYHRLLNLSPSV